MLDPITTPLLLLVLGKIGEELLTDACKDFLKDKLKTLFGWLGSLGGRSDLELAYEAAMKDAYTLCLEMLLKNIAACGYTNEELKSFADSLKKFIRDQGVAATLLDAVKNPLDPNLPSTDILAKRWQELGCRELPGDPWTGTALAFRRKATKQAFLNAPLRDVLNAQNLDAIREVLEREGGVRPEVRQDKYALRMRGKYSPVDLANLMPSYAENPGQLVIRDVFVPQHVKENPPPVELPKDFEQRLRDKGVRDIDELPADKRREFIEEQHEKLSSVYVSQARRPVLDVIAEPSNRLVMLVGEPGSGKSTLLRYLLLGVLEPPRQAETDTPLPWTVPFTASGSFPLLIELRDFHATRRTNDDVDSFLDYANYMGRTEQYFIDDQWLDHKLQAESSVVLFDGLDEIFDRGDREKTMHEIAGFAERYQKARIVVTSRPVGYRDAILRQAGFRHFGLQDLDEGQIETFTRGWFRLTFPQQSELSAQRIERVLSSVKRSRPILLLAGNPMLLTIMALLAREQELPRERAAFYEAAVNVLCHHWDANRNLTLPATEYLRVEDKKELLRRVAMRMQTATQGLAGNAIHETDLEEEVSAWFVDRFKQTPHDAIKSARLMIEQLRERNYILCLRGPRLYGFVHRTFLEFLTAAEYVARFKDAQTMTIGEMLALYDEHCRDEDWREVLRLIAGQINEQFVGQIVEQLATRADLSKWGSDAPLPQLPLAIYCLSEVRNLPKLEATGAILLDTIMSLFVSGDGNKEFHEELLNATQEIQDRWPGVGDLNRRVFAQLSRIGDNTWATVFLPQFMVTIAPDRQTQERLLSSDIATLRWGALQALAQTWPDDSTRELLSTSAVNDQQEYVRSAALQALAQTWSDDLTREFLSASAVKDPDPGPRSAALQALAQTWPDDSTREFLSASAVNDPDGGPRSDALQALAQTWPDDSTRELLAASAVNDPGGGPRSDALRALAQTWPDDSTRELLAASAVNDPDGGPRNAALRALAQTWPDDSTRELLAASAVNDPDGGPRNAALQALAQTWPGDSTRELLSASAVNDQQENIRSVALRALAQTWRDDSTRELLSASAVKDLDAGPRSAALQALAQTWPDDSTRELLSASAANDPEAGPRSAALQALAQTWPDKSTRELLRARAVEDQEKHTRGSACSLLGQMHSKFGRILLTRDLDGSAPFLDPLLPIPRVQIERAAAKAGIASAELDAQLTSLNQHLGWDITVGARPASGKQPSSKRRRRSP